MSRPTIDVSVEISALVRLTVEFDEYSPIDDPGVYAVTKILLPITTDRVVKIFEPDTDAVNDQIDSEFDQRCEILLAEAKR
jgi:hypothetical protein